MKLKELVKDITYRCLWGDMNTEISDICYDSRKVSKNCVFVCIDGFDFDGHQVIDEVISQGAIALIVTKAIIITNIDITVICVDDSRCALSFMAGAYFQYPNRHLFMIGITGTKGKTTTAYLLKSIFEKSGYRVGLIGTTGIEYGKRKIKTNNTTPDAYTIFYHLKQMELLHCHIVVMEVSSQGLMMGRVSGICFDIGLVTNLEADHIGPKEHKNLAEYICWKSTLLQQCKIGIVNRDMSYFNSIVKGSTCQLETYGFSSSSNTKITAWGLKQEDDYLGVKCHLQGLTKGNYYINSPGKFSVYNALAAITVCRHLNISESCIHDALSNFSVIGRMEFVQVSKEFKVIIDYAHNAMALENLLTSLRAYQPKRLICVFGCGGNRSVERRFEMGEVSGRLADVTIITSDNPREELPFAIMQDIEVGMKKTMGTYNMIENRKEAIAYAIHCGLPGDFIVIAGKGHEVYQEIKGVKYPMDERTLIQEILEESKDYGKTIC